MLSDMTKGPWAVCTDATGDTFIASMTDSAETVCELGSADNDEGQAQLEADAQAIAALPELIELAYQYASDLRYPPTGDGLQRRLERIEDVLTKAGGSNAE